MIRFGIGKERPPCEHCAKEVCAAQMALGLLTGLCPERCPDELAERTIRLLCAAAAQSRAGRTHAGRLSLSP
jgi:hypothetical protein